MYDKIAKWYKQGLWSVQMVNNAVKKGVITTAQSAEILGVTTYETQ